VTTTSTELGQEPVEVAEAEPDDLTLWSVTTIIGVLDKPALLYWAAEQTANAAIDSANTWQAMAEDEGRDAAVKWLRDARFRRPKTKLTDAALGTVVHKVCETYALTGTKPGRDFVEHLIVREGGPQADVEGETNLVGTMLNQFDGWLQRFTPSYQATEVCVYCPEYGYAGQADAFLTIDGVRLLADYKSTRNPRDSQGRPKTPYPEQVALQLGAYRNATYAAVWRPRRFEKFRRRYYLLSAAERELAVPVPEVDTGLVIQITPESCEAYPIRCDEEVHTAFLFCLEGFRWVQETSKTVMSEPLTEAS
jgi:ATP-dependent exoDNAse (exonuclease V) beta subunit